MSEKFLDHHLKPLPTAAEKITESMSAEELNRWAAVLKAKSQKMNASAQQKKIMGAQEEKIAELNNALNQKIFAIKCAFFAMVFWGFLAVLLTRLMPINLLQELQRFLPSAFFNDLLLFLLGCFLFNLASNVMFTGLFFIGDVPQRPKKTPLLEAMYGLYAPCHPDEKGAHAMAMGQVVEDLKKHFGMEVTLSQLEKALKADRAWQQKKIPQEGMCLFVKFKKARP